MNRRWFLWLPFAAILRAQEPTLYGFWSDDAVAHGQKTIFWLRPDGREVEVTAVFEDKEAKSYEWPDKKMIGIVAKPSRPGRPGKRSHYGL